MLLLVFAGRSGAARTAEAGGARRPAEFKLLKTVELPSLGLKIRLMPEAHETPPAPPNALTYEWRNGERKWKDERYVPEELWRQQQFAGAWRDESDNSLTLARILLPLPSGFPQKHCTREEYDAKAAAAEAAWSRESLTQWAADFLGEKDLTSEVVAKRPASLAELLAFASQSGTSRITYAFRMNRSATGQSRAPTNWFFGVFEVNPKVATDKARQTIMQDFFKNLTTCRTPTMADHGPARDFQASMNRTPAAARSPVFLVSRRQVADSIRNMSDWWFVETENYIILSNLKSKYKVLVKELQVDIEALWPAFCQIIPPRKPIESVSVIRVIADPGDYIKYVGEERKWTGGLWMPGHKELVIRALDLGGSKEQRQQVLRAAFHEAFHQYLYYALDQIEASAWYNEGHAVLFGNADVGNRRFEIGEDEAMAAKVLEFVETGKADLGKLMRLSYKDFYGADREQNYALAWAMVYYLRKGAVPETGSEHAGLLDRYLDILWEDKNADKATETLLSDVKLDTLQGDFNAFWKSHNRRGAARRYDLLDRGRTTTAPQESKRK